MKSSSNRRERGRHGGILEIDSYGERQVLSGEDVQIKKTQKRKS